MPSIRELVAHADAFSGLSAPKLEVLSGCASARTFRDGELLGREGEPADTLHLLLRGSVAVETFVPRRGAVVIETLHDGELVGWSWLDAPARWRFDVRARGPTETLAFEGACLRRRCAGDPELAAEIYRRVARVILERLQGARLRLLDVYGHAGER